MVTDHESLLRCPLDLRRAARAIVQLGSELWGSFVRVNQNESGSRKAAGEDGYGRQKSLGHGLTPKDTECSRRESRTAEQSTADDAD